ncbi:MAG: hypothetical protein ABSC65_27615 [Acidobacteriaceae bacterium]|jgi:hypothetical protein
MKYLRAAAVPILFVATPSAQADRTESVLQSMGLSVTRADNICFAEVYAEAQHFAGAVYDQSLSGEEQVSLARVMRIRWPWMRIIRWVSPGNSLFDDTLFDCSALSESQLAACVEHSLGG